MSLLKMLMGAQSRDPEDAYTAKPLQEFHPCSVPETAFPVPSARPKLPNVQFDLLKAVIVFVEARPHSLVSGPQSRWQFFCLQTRFASLVNKRTLNPDVCILY